jgi:hypothetical protein
MYFSEVTQSHPDGGATEYLLSPRFPDAQTRRVSLVVGVDLTTALTVAGAVGIYDGGTYLPLNYVATPAAGQPIVFKIPFLLGPGVRVYFMTNQATAGDDCRLFIQGEVLD